MVCKGVIDRSLAWKSAVVVFLMIFSINPKLNYYLFRFQLNSVLYTRKKVMDPELQVVIGTKWSCLRSVLIANISKAW